MKKLGIAITVSVVAALILIVLFATFWHQIAHASSLVPTVKSIQVTIGSGTTQVTTTDTFCKQIFFQNNAAAVMRVGDSTTTSSKGVSLSSGPSGGSWTVTSQYGATLDLADYYVNGTSTQVLDVACITQ